MEIFLIIIFFSPLKVNIEIESLLVIGRIFCIRLEFD